MQTVTVSAARRQDYTGASVALEVTDDDVPLVLDLAIADASIAEGAGAAATTATVTRSDPRGNLTVTLTSDDVSEATLPATITLLDGESSATVDIAAVDDPEVGRRRSRGTGIVWQMMMSPSLMPPLRDIRRC